VVERPFVAVRALHGDVLERLRDLGRSKKTVRSVRTAIATARDAATQPIVEPRARYGSIARKYDPALAAAVTTRPTASATRNRRPPTFVCETGPQSHRHHGAL
jgi:hypothetical protein